MSDLQCPAIFHVCGPDVGRERIAEVMREVPIVAVLVADDRRLAQAGVDEYVVEIVDVGFALRSVLEEAADEYRGRHLLVLASRVEPPLRRLDDEVEVRVDADGMTVLRP